MLPSNRWRKLNLSLEPMLLASVTLAVHRDDAGVTPKCIPVGPPLGFRQGRAVTPFLLMRAICDVGLQSHHRTFPACPPLS
jgi:hypothetical protein